MRKLSLIQGIYFVVTGLWPWVHFASFAVVTDIDGPAWSFQAIGLLIACIGFALVVAARRTPVTRPVCVLGAGSALALAVIDLDLMRAAVIGRLNALDVVVQLGFAAGWFFVARASAGRR